ncbi:MAG: CotH kinase family protein [Verrucomicrobiales bacterium]|nr:CotH kinase family protein [Verrucomicrobiales bacterium]
MRSPTGNMINRLAGLFLALLLFFSNGCGHSADSSAATPLSGKPQATHQPALPKSGEPVHVAITLDPSNHLAQLTLQLQRVEPGHYRRRNDRDFAKDWRDFPMNPDPAMDPKAASGQRFAATIPGELQKHRSLIRYRFRGVTTEGSTVAWPDPTNGCPNLAWFVYDGLPAWTGASQPGRTEPKVFKPEFLGTLPVYQLIARSEDVEKSQWSPDHNREPFFGTLVYDGRVYDHIRFNNRGQASTYVAGKNKWGFHFVEGEEFQARDAWGRPYKHPWKGFNLNACASPWAQVNRGMAGMDEALSYRAFQLAGVPSPDTFWIHFRIVDKPLESAGADQYGTDLWGLYLVVQDKNGAWLRERGLPSGNLYSAESGLKYRAAGMPEDGSDLRDFFERMTGSPTEEWWRHHLDVPAFNSFHAMNRVLGNVDLRPDGNYYLYHRPDDRWVVLPHDLDMMFIPRTHWPGTMQAVDCLDFPALRLEYRNRAREIIDLFCSDAQPAGGQIGQLVTELSRFVAPPGQSRTWAELDEAMWNWHPASQTQGEFNVDPCRDRRFGGSWIRRLSRPDFAGFCQYILHYGTDTRPEKNYRPNDGDQRGYGFGFLQFEARDNEIPDQPMIRAAEGSGTTGGIPKFTVTPFASPKGRPFRSIQWRVAEIRAEGIPGYDGKGPWRYELEETWASGPVTRESTEFRLDSAVCQPGRTYRIRARYADTTGRCSHWSEPATFTPRAATQR